MKINYTTTFIFISLQINLAVANDIDFEKNVLEKYPLIKLIEENGIEYSDVLNDRILFKYAYNDVKTPNNFYATKYTAPNIYLLGKHHSKNFIVKNKIQARNKVQILLNEFKNENYKVIVSEFESEKFYDFSTNYVTYRVHKANWVQWKIQDYMIFPFLGSTIVPNRIELSVGFINKKYLNPTSIINLGEYSWLVLGIHIDDMNKIIRSVLFETPNEFIHLLYEIEILGGDWGIYDEINLSIIKIKTIKNTREIIVSVNILKKIKGQYGGDAIIGSN